MRPLPIILIVPLSLILAACQTTSWHHETYGDATEVPERFNAAKAKALVAYQRVLASAPPVQIQPLPQRAPSYDLQGTSSYYDSQGSVGYGTYYGTAQPRSNTNFMAAFEEGRQIGRISAANELASNSIAATQAIADQAFVDAMAKQGWHQVTRTH